MTNFQSYQIPENLLIFKTNIRSKQALKAVKKEFKAHQSIKDWWVDLDDIDKVMRIELHQVLPEQDIIKILGKLGLDCNPLPD